MSYLAALRLHFAGQFQAAPSTVNNDPLHFDNDTFKPTDKLPSLPPPGDPRGWWNPRGNADWRFIGCRVTGASYADGTRATAEDPVLRMVVADADRRAAAKMADLDTEQQLVSEIWGLEVRICDGNGMTVVRGEFAPAAFIDIWDRAQGPGGGGDIGACATYQSIVSDLEWGDLGGSRLLGELRDAAADEGLLSMRFNVDGYNMTLGSPDFTRGRIAGTIGVASASEPKHFVAGRQFMARAASGGNFFKPTGSINFCTALVDEELGRIFIDLGNALPTVGPGGPQEDLGELTVGYVVAGESKLTSIGVIDYRADAWYPQSAGVVEVALDEAQVAAIREAELGLNLSSVASVTFESPGGLYVKADDFVHRLDPGDAAEVAVFATRYGRPYAGAEIVAVEDPSGLQIQVAPGDPDVGTPGSAISFAKTLEPTGEDGRATLRIEASDPGNPRVFIDGQVFGVRPSLAGQAADYPTDPWNFISVLVFDEFKADEPITWWGGVQPVFQQYSNLYPVMDDFLDLSDYKSVCANLDLLELAFDLDTGNPNSMPVTRDLARSKRAAILRWMGNRGPDGKPLLGTPPPPGAPKPAILTGTAPGATAPPGAWVSGAAVSGAAAARGGKAAAAARRVGFGTTGGRDAR
jgi:hypothetical protein